MLNTLLMNKEWQSNSGCPLPNYFKTISGGDVVEEEEGMEGDTTKATSILACAHNCTAWDECCSFEFDKDNADEDEACSLNAACRPTRNVPGKLFCTRGIVDFKRCAGKTRWWPSYDSIFNVRSNLPSRLQTTNWSKICDLWELQEVGTVCEELHDKYYWRRS